MAATSTAHTTTTAVVREGQAGTTGRPTWEAAMSNFTTTITCPYEQEVVGRLVAGVLGGCGNIAQLLTIAEDYLADGETELAAWYQRAAHEVVHQAT